MEYLLELPEKIYKNSTTFVCLVVEYCIKRVDFSVLVVKFVFSTHSKTTSKIVFSFVFCSMCSFYLIIQLYSQSEYTKFSHSGTWYKSQYNVKKIVVREIGKKYVSLQEDRNEVKKSIPSLNELFCLVFTGSCFPSFPISSENWNKWELKLFAKMVNISAYSFDFPAGRNRMTNTLEFCFFLYAWIIWTEIHV